MIFAPGEADQAAIAEPANRPLVLNGPGQRVRLEFVVDTLGRPERCRVIVRHESHPGLGEQLLPNVLAWRYRPPARQAARCHSWSRWW